MTVRNAQEERQKYYITTTAVKHPQITASARLAYEEIFARREADKIEEASEVTRTKQTVTRMSQSLPKLGVLTPKLLNDLFL